MNGSFLYHTYMFGDFNPYIHRSILFFFDRLIKTLLEENVSSMSDHITNAMDKMDSVLDKKIAEKDAVGGEKSG